MDTQKYEPNWNTRTYSQDQFEKSWLESKSIAECARKLDLTVHGSTYSTLKNTAKYLNLSDSHMTGRGWNKGGKSTYNPKPIGYYLDIGTQIGSSSLKKKLLKEGLLSEKCSLPFCPNPEYTIDGFTGEKVKTPLTLDHINGINNDNRLENLRLVCANCDRQNPTFCRGSISNQNKIKKVKVSTKQKKTLCTCGNKKERKSLKCKDCDIKLRKSGISYKGSKTKIEWPPDEDLLRMLSNMSFLSASKVLGVSDNAIRKRLKKRNLQVSK